jgi:hypothetical protein
MQSRRSSSWWPWWLGFLGVWALVGCGSTLQSPPVLAPGPDVSAASDASEAEPETAPPAPAEETVASANVVPASEAVQGAPARSLPSSARAKDAPAGPESKPNVTSGVAEREPIRQDASSPGRAPLLVYTATVTMAVFGLDDALAAVEAVAGAHRGYLVRRSDTSITIRVPASAFQETLAGVGKLGDELHRDVSARDVTEQYTDLEIRLRNAEVVRERLESLLAKTSSVSEAISVEHELARVTDTIEELKGKLKLLSELVAFSTITVNFQPRGVEHVNPEHTLPFEWLKQLGLSNLLSL